MEKLRYIAMTSCPYGQDLQDVGAAIVEYDIGLEDWQEPEPWTKSLWWHKGLIQPSGPCTYKAWLLLDQAAGGDLVNAIVLFRGQWCQYVPNLPEFYSLGLAPFRYRVFIPAPVDAYQGRQF